MPTHSVINGICTCHRGKDCKSPGKHPIVDKHSDATTNEETIQQWWDEHPEANIACFIDNSVVLDIDPRNDGMNSYVKLISVAGDPPSTPTVETGGDGLHIWFRDNRSAIGNSSDYPGIDVLSGDKYCVMPPSIHASGKTYEWTSDYDPLEQDDFNQDCFAPLPEQYATIFKHHVSAMKAERVSRFLYDPPAEEIERLKQILYSDVGINLASNYNAAVHMPPGYSPTMIGWIHVGLALYHTSWRCGFELFDEWSRIADDKLSLGKYDGTLELRKRWNEFSTNGRRFKIASLYALAKSALLRFDEQVELSPTTIDQDFLESAQHLIQNIKSVPTLIENLLVKGSTALLVGPSGIGKTFLAIDISLSIATGKAWWGENVSQGSVIYVNAEGRMGFSKRLGAWLDFHHQEAPDNFYVTKRNLFISEESEVAGFIELAQKVQPVLVVIDTLAQNFGPGADESSTKDMTLFVNNCQRLSNELEATILIVHHTGHHAYRARGSSALLAAVDTEMTIVAQGDFIELTITKQRDLELKDPILLYSKRVSYTDPNGVEHVSLVINRYSDMKPPLLGIQKTVFEEIEKQMQEVTERLKEMGKQDDKPEVSKRQLEIALQVDTQTLSKSLRTLEKDGRIKQTRYNITDIIYER